MFKMLLTTLCLVSGLIFGETYYVSSSSGDDSNNGTSQSSPWKTLNKVNSFNFNPGDKILFKRDDVWSNSYLEITRSGNSSNNIYFGAYGNGDMPVLLAGNSSNVILYITGRFITVDNLHFKGIPTGTGLGSTKKSIMINNRDNVIQNCIVEGKSNNTDSQTIGVLINTDALKTIVTNCEVYWFKKLIQVEYSGIRYPRQNAEITHCTLRDTRPMASANDDGDCIKISAGNGNAGTYIAYNDFSGWSNDAVDGRGMNLLVEYNNFHDPQTTSSGGQGVKFGNGAVGNPNPEIESDSSICRYNNFYNWNITTQLESYQGRVITTGTSYTKVYYNILYNINNAHGISVAGGQGASINQEIYNNTLVNVGGSIVEGGGGIVHHHAFNLQNNASVVNLRLKNNILGGVGGNNKDAYFGSNGCISTNNVFVNDNYNIRSGVSVTQSNNTTGTPIFVNSSSNDFRLAANDTRAKDKGSVLSGIPLVDMDGNPVPFGSSPDIGAYEYIDGNLGGDNVNLNLKILLEGPFENNQMKTYINEADGLPLNQPYNVTPWNYSGNESVSSFSPDIVDWVLVELRSGTSASTMVARKAALIRNTGEVVDLDGESKVNFEDVSDGAYYVVVYHRNHLGVMSSTPIELNGNSNLYDFSSSSSSAYGNNALTELENGKWGLLAGDGDNNSIINNIDYGSVGNHLFEVGYILGDFDMNGIINIIDYAKTYKNILKSSQVPN